MIITDCCRVAPIDPSTLFAPKVFLLIATLQILIVIGYFFEIACPIFRLNSEFNSIQLIWWGASSCFWHSVIQLGRCRFVYGSQIASTINCNESKPSHGDVCFKRKRNARNAGQEGRNQRQLTMKPAGRKNTGNCWPLPPSSSFSSPPLLLFLRLFNNSSTRSNTTKWNKVALVITVLVCGAFIFLCLFIPIKFNLIQLNYTSIECS